MTTTPIAELAPGALFAGEFEIVRVLGRGGMGAVYEVVQRSTGRRRALKLMHPLLVSDAKSRERFAQEARVGARADTDHVVEVVAAGIEERTGTPWLCMELLEGETLAERVARAGALHGPEALAVLRQLGHALGAAHAAGLVHRDLKPENVFLARARLEGVPFTLKLLDLGIAKLVGEARLGSTSTQAVGSPMWMAPEQTDVGRVSPASDVWALGLLAFYALTGDVFWNAPRREGATLQALLVEMLVEPIPPASERARERGALAGLPAGFDAWFARCVSREPAARYADARIAIDALLALSIGGSPAAGLPQPAASTRATAMAATIAASTPHPATPPTSGRRPAALVAIGAFAVAIVGALALVAVAAIGGGETESAAVEVPPIVPQPNAGGGRADAPRLLHATDGGAERLPAPEPAPPTRPARRPPAALTTATAEGAETHEEVGVLGDDAQDPIPGPALRLPRISVVRDPVMRQFNSEVVQRCVAGAWPSDVNEPVIAEFEISFENRRVRGIRVGMLDGTVFRGFIQCVVINGASFRPDQPPTDSTLRWRRRLAPRAGQ